MAPGQFLVPLLLLLTGICQGSQVNGQGSDNADAREIISVHANELDDTPDISWLANYKGSENNNIAVVKPVKAAPYTFRRTSFWSRRSSSCTTSNRQQSLLSAIGSTVKNVWTALWSLKPRTTTKCPVVTTKPTPQPTTTTPKPTTATPKPTTTTPKSTTTPKPTTTPEATTTTSKPTTTTPEPTTLQPTEATNAPKEIRAKSTAAFTQTTATPEPTFSPNKTQSTETTEAVITPESTFAPTETASGETNESTTTTTTKAHVSTATPKHIPTTTESTATTQKCPVEDLNPLCNRHVEKGAGACTQPDIAKYCRKSCCLLGFIKLFK